MEGSQRSGVLVADEPFGEVKESETTSEARLEREGSKGGLGRSILSAAADATAISNGKNQRAAGEIYDFVLFFGRQKRSWWKVEANNGAVLQPSRRDVDNIYSRTVDSRGGPFHVPKSKQSVELFLLSFFSLYSGRS